MHALDHIRESFSKLRKLAEARENWRKTRVKLALANPGLILTMYVHPREVRDSVVLTEMDLNGVILQLHEGYDARWQVPLRLVWKSGSHDWRRMLPRPSSVEEKA